MQEKIKMLEAGEKVNGIYLLKDANIRPARNGTNYLTGTASDKTGDIAVKMWEYTDEAHLAMRNFIEK